MVGQAKSGRLHEFVDRLEAINERVMAHGATGVRHTRNAISGPATGTLNTRSSFADLASWAEAMDNLAQDEAWQQLIFRELLSTDGPLIQTAAMLRRRINL
ncbi:MAG: hypothetical protein R3A46_12605 [Thermomicrobiales bacterium]